MDEFDYFSHESLLIVTPKGGLKRLKTPFKALLLVSIDQLEGNKVYLITAVVVGYDDIMKYSVKGHLYYYYLFIVL